MEEVTAHPMNGGSGLHSYTKNSTFQRKVTENTKELIKKAIEELNIRNFLSFKTINIVDMGCSTGPNTFLAVQNIINSLEHKLNSEPENSVTIPEFQVFFNDLASNDFNQLFQSLPPERKYFATGVPGSFHGPLFPNESLHFVHSSSSLHWLSRVPTEVTDKNSPAWNKGRAYYSNSTDQVVRAYEAQFAKDMDKFLKFRAKEVVGDGLMALTFYGRSSGSSHSEAFINKSFQMVEKSLIDMHKEGKISDEKLDSFNIPMYYASPEEIESAVKRSESFSIETMETISVVLQVPHKKYISSPFRAILEGIIKVHFGQEISDEFFETVLPKNLLDFSAFFTSFELITFFVVLKRV